VNAAVAQRTEVVTGAVVFTDIVGFTEYTAIQGDKEALAILARQESTVRASLPRGSRLIKELGDGLLLFFGDACEAIETCLHLQEELERLQSEDAFPLWVRIGVHWGQPTRWRDDIVGHDVNVAARIVALAGPGEVICSQAAVIATGIGMAGVSFQELGPVVMKGIPKPMPLFRAERG
jgi:adenylate cyclase